MPRVPIAFHSYQHRYLPVSAQRLINWMPEQQPREAKAPVVLMPTPGIAEFADLQGDEVRGLHVMGPNLYAIVGISVKRVDVTGGVTTLGSISAGGLVHTADNGQQLAIVAPNTGEGWIATSSSLTKITDPDFPAVTDVAFLDGYFAFVRMDTGRFIISAINDGTQYDALDFATAESSPDNLVAIERVGNNLWLFGERSIEFWESAPGADFPFARQYGGAIGRGCSARGSVATRDRTAFWLAENRTVCRASGAEVLPISTRAIDQAIAGYSLVSDARGWCYDQEGHEFYVLHFPTAGATWVWDDTTREWHERESEGYGGLWRVAQAVSYGGAVIGGDFRTGRLYVVSPTIGSEDGAAIIRVATGAPAQAEGKLMFFHRVELDCATGVGLAEGQGSDPKVWLTWSDDGGRTWSSERWGALGRRGEYGRRVAWDRLGAAWNRVLRFAMSDPVGTPLIAANVTVVVGAH